MLILNAKILKDFQIKVWFEDKVITIDLAPELQNDFWYYEPYRDEKKFQKEFVFDKDLNMIAWGENWDIHFDTPDIWEGMIGRVISDIPIKQKWTIQKYARHFGLTRLAIYQKIWNSKLPDNVRVESAPLLEMPELRDEKLSCSVLRGRKLPDIKQNATTLTKFMYLLAVKK